MPGLKGSSLCAPLSNSQFQTFKHLMDQEFKECSAITEKYIKGAMENGNWFMEDIMKHQKIVSYAESLTFLVKYELISDAEIRLNNFNKFLVRSQMLIAQAKRYNELSKQEQQVQDLLNQMFLLQSQAEYEKLVEVLFSLHDLALDLRSQQKQASDTESHAGFGLMISNIERCTQDVVTQLSYDPGQLCSFAFELRKKDTENRYTYEFLNGQVRQVILVKIICANRWDEQLQRMVIDSIEDAQFTIRSNKHRGVLTYDPDSCQSKLGVN